MVSSAKLVSWRWCNIVMVVVLAACGQEPTRVVEPPAAHLAKGGGSASTVTVTGASPGYGKRGERLSVRITGSGFTATSQAGWERNGVLDPRVTVLSTTFVSATELVADVQIAEDSDLDFYDVAVTITLVDGGRKKGVGIEMFEVTTAILLPELSGPGGNGAALSLNDAGRVVGRSHGNAFVWSESFGIEALGPGEATDISEAGTTIVGMNNSGTPRDAMVWTGDHGSWTGAKLSTTCVTGVEWSMARSISRQGTLIGGVIQAGRSRQARQYPVVWDTPESNCRKLPIPEGYDGGRVADVSSVDLVAGFVSQGSTLRAIVWDASTAPTFLDPVPGDVSSRAFAIAPNGSIITGMSGDRAAYWVRTASGWSGAIALAPKCISSGQGWGRAVNDAGVIMANACDGGRWFRVENGVVVESELMPGLGPTDHPVAEAITNNTSWGQPWAAGGGAGATYWRVP